MNQRAPKQLSFPEQHGWGGPRKGAGRKRGPRANTPHRIRPFHDEHDPVHVTLKLIAGLPSLRRRDLFEVVRGVLVRPSAARFAIVHFSVQSDHVHLIVEAKDRGELSSGMRGLTIRLARAVNDALGRRGRLFATRYHARALHHRREVRNALVYVLLNWRKHHDRRGVDPCSSGGGFDGWAKARWRGSPSGLAPPSTWLLRVGWREQGLLDPYLDAPR